MSAAPYFWHVLGAWGLSAAVLGGQLWVSYRRARFARAARRGRGR